MVDYYRIVLPFHTYNPQENATSLAIIVHILLVLFGVLIELTVHVLKAIKTRIHMYVLQVRSGAAFNDQW